MSRISWTRRCYRAITCGDRVAISQQATTGFKRHLQSLSSHPSSTARRKAVIIALGVVTAVSIDAFRRCRDSLLLDSQQTGPSVTKRKRLREIKHDELEKHNTADSLWVAVDGIVWDVTDFLPDHPGGREILLAHAGQDVTQVFKGIHPAGTIDRALSSNNLVGSLDSSGSDGISQSPETERINQARANLPPIDSIFVINDFEAVAKDLCPDAAWDYYSAAAETYSAYKGNFNAYERVFFRPRVMRDVREVDTSTDILGSASTVPFYVAPTARNGLAQELGEIAVTRGAGTTGALQILSHVASRGLDEVMAERKEGQEVGWQLYMKPDRVTAEKEIRRAVELGVQSIWITADMAVPPKQTEHQRNTWRRNPVLSKQPVQTTGPAAKLSNRHDSGLVWEDIAWVKSLAPDTPLVIKGIGAWEDVALAQQYGADAVVLSNHGGRALDYANAPLRTLRDINVHAPELIKNAQFQIFVDGGVRSGNDVIKALCLGANAVGLGRPFIYAAAGWGQQGVEKAILILRDEIERTMRHLGVTRLDQLSPAYLELSDL